MNKAYTLYHPKWYRTAVSTYWWTRRWSYLQFITRELTSIFVGYFAVITLLLVRALALGPDSYNYFLAWLRQPWLIALNIFTFLFLLFHTITWFNLAPKALGLRVGGRKVPAAAISLPNYLLWLIISAALAWLLNGGRV